MNYTIPTTKAEMYQSLNEIYQFYRLNRTTYEHVSLDVLEIDEIEFTPLTDAELRLKAQTVLAYGQGIKMLEKKTELSRKIAEIDEKILLLDSEYSEKAEKTESDYSEKISKIETDANKKGLMRSNITITKLSELLAEKDRKIALLTIEKQQKQTGYLSIKSSLSDELDDLDDVYTALFAKEVDKVFYELKDKQDEKILEIEKYNNSVNEKNTRSHNNALFNEATLDIKRIDAQAEGLTKEQLMDLGYYKDVIDCIYAYYSTLPPQNAYSDILTESKLLLYLEDYYDDTVSFYRLRATA